jgi:hypothetical protein
MLDSIIIIIKATARTKMLLAQSSFAASSHFFPLSLLVHSFTLVFGGFIDRRWPKAFRKAERRALKSSHITRERSYSCYDFFFSFASNLSAFSFRFFGIVFSIVFEVNS